MVREPLTVLVAGATGLVGSALVRQLGEAPGVARVTALSRRPLDVGHERLQVTLLNLAQLDAFSPEPAHVACCALNPLLVGPLARYRAVRAERVAAAMVACACDEPGWASELCDSRRRARRSSGHGLPAHA